MNPYADMMGQLKTPETIEQFAYIYGKREGTLVQQSARYTRLLKGHEKLYNHGEGLRLISAPGRTEISGNHTDHNRGKVLAAAVTLDTLVAVSPRDDMKVNLQSEGFPSISLDLTDLSVQEEEKGTTLSLIRGVAAWLVNHGMRAGGFDALMTSTVAVGSGLSSSAAVEVLFCSIFDELYNGGHAIDFKQRGIAAQYAENVYFGKPSGLMDQMASSAGGLVYIDFADDDPVVRPISYDFAKKGYTLVVVSTGGSHDDLTPSYAAIPEEMRKVAAWFGESNLRPIMPERFYNAIPQIRKELGSTCDRALMRAAHFFEENKRVTEQVSALEADNLPAFLSLVRESGNSSFCYLQNVYPSETREEEALGLMMAERALRKDGAWRVHGGGFAGTILTFVPNRQVNSFVEDMESVFGNHSCHVLDIRPVGPAVLKL